MIPSLPNNSEEGDGIPLSLGIPDTTFGSPVSSSVFEDTDDLNHIQNYQGFSNSLLLLVNEVCDLGKRLEDENLSEGNCSEENTLVEDVIRLRSSLESLTQLPPKSRHIQGDDSMAYNAPSPSSSRDHHRQLEVIMATAEANRVAALLFLDETFSTRFPSLFSSDTRKRRSAYKEAIFTCADTICENGIVTSALPIWPIFLAGYSAVTDEDRSRVLAILDRFQSQSWFGVSASTSPPTNDSSLPHFLLFWMNMHWLLYLVVMS